MLPNILKNKNILILVIAFAVLAIFALAASIPRPTSNSHQATANSEPTHQTSRAAPIDLETSSSDSFRYADQKDLKKIMLTRDFLRETTSFLTCQLKGLEPVDPRIDCITELSKAHPDPNKFRQSGPIYFASNAIASLYTQPASAVDYTHTIASNFGIQKAEAQNTGTGFNSLSQIQSLWTIFRNITYLLLLIIFVVIGIAIMLRINIDPRTVMSIQNQIPRAIIAIILITFSYAIAGLLIDAMWIGTYFGVNVVTEAQPNCKIKNERTNAVEEKALTSVVTRDLLNNPIGFTSNILGDETGCQGTYDGIQGLALQVGRTFGDIIARGGMVVFGLDEDLGNCGTGLDLPIVGKIFGGDGSIENCIKIAFFSILKYIIAILGFLVAWIAILVALFRVWFSMLKAYIFVIIDILLGPFYILLGLIPGSSFSFKGWVRSILAQLAFFPAVTLMLIIASIFARNPEINNPGENVFLPPLIGNPNIADNLGALIAFGFILLTPDVGNIIREALKSPASKATGGITAITGFAVGKTVGSFKGVEERYSHRNEAVLKADGQGKADYVKRGFGAILGKRLGG